MKKLFTFLMVVAMSTTTAFSQAGSFAIGVGSNMANTSWQDYNLEPTVGYFMSDNMMVGMGFNFGSSTVTNDNGTPDDADDDIDTKTSGLSLSPFFRYYLNEMFYAHGGIGLTTGSTKVGDADATTTSSFDLDAGVGLSLMWNEKVAIEPSLGLAIGSGENTSSFGIAMGLGINIRLGE